MDVILNTCVSPIKYLTTLVLSELEKDLHFAATRYADVYLLSIRKEFLCVLEACLAFN